MQLGMEMMMKSMGFDPEKIKESLTAARDEIIGIVKELRDKQDEIAASQARIEKQLALMFSENPIGGIDHPHI